MGMVGGFRKKAERAARCEAAQRREQERRLKLLWVASLYVRRFAVCRTARSSDRALGLSFAARLGVSRAWPLVRGTLGRVALKKRPASDRAAGCPR